MSSPSLKQLRCLRAVAQAGNRVDHEDPCLKPFLDDAKTDTFNQCHKAGWLKTWRDDRMDCSAVELTKSGREALAAKQ